LLGIRANLCAAKCRYLEHPCSKISARLRRIFLAAPAKNHRIYRIRKFFYTWRANRAQLVSATEPVKIAPRWRILNDLVVCQK
jgi:hypothetical protein